MSDHGKDQGLDGVRDAIERLDVKLIMMIAERTAFARAAGRLKVAAGLPVTDPAREAAVARLRGRGAL